MGYFKVSYDSRFVIYERKMFIRLATGGNHPTTTFALHSKNMFWFCTEKSALSW